MLCADIPPRIYESLKTLCCLATAASPLQAHEIASAAHLPPAQTAKILQFMTWAGFVDSRRGTKGGFWLIRPAKKIRVTDVTDFFSHLHPHDKTTKGNGLRKALEEAMARCRKAFEAITIADLAKVCECDRVGAHSLAKDFPTKSHRKPMHRSVRP
jgi:Rrf2 family protein